MQVGLFEGGLGSGVMWYEFWNLNGNSGLEGISAINAHGLR